MRSILAGHDPAPVEQAPAHGGECVNPGSVPAADELRNPATHQHLDWLLAEIRGQQPFENLAEAPIRPNLPM